MVKLRKIGSRFLATPEREAGREIFENLRQTSWDSNGRADAYSKVTIHSRRIAFKEDSANQKERGS
jgi:hypothetical protein